MSLADSDSDDYRFNLPAEKYLEHHDVLVYLEDAVTQLLDHKDENPKVIPTKFFSEYFNSVKEGNHVIFREYAYVNATLHNRSSFVRMVWKCFRHIGRKGDLLSVQEYHALLCLLCPDFPFLPMQKTARIILMEDAIDSLISFSDFLYAFQVQFCYDEFLSECAETFKSLLNSSNNIAEPVVVPTETLTGPARSSSNDPPGHSEPSSMVDTMHLFRALSALVNKTHKAPPKNVLQEILLGAKKTTFYGFLMALAKSESLNISLGKLPNKTELLDMTDQELTSPATQQCSAPGQPVSQDSRASQPPVSEAGATQGKSPKPRPLPSTAALRRQIGHLVKAQPMPSTPNPPTSDDTQTDSDDTSNT